MARYRKIDPRIWNDEKFCGLSERGKLVFFFVLTHPNMTALGAMRQTVDGMGAELNLGAEAFREAFGEALSKGMVEVDRKAPFIWLPNFLRYNQPESPNVIKAWTAALDLLPECEAKIRLIHRVFTVTKDLPEAFRKALPEAFRKVFAKTLPYQEQEQEYSPSRESANGQKLLIPGGEKLNPGTNIPPAPAEVEEYMAANGNPGMGGGFYDYHESAGWMIGKKKMVNWQAACRTWIGNAAKFSKGPNHAKRNGAGIKKTDAYSEPQTYNA